MGQNWDQPEAKAAGQGTYIGLLVRTRSRRQFRAPAGGDVADSS